MNHKYLIEGPSDYPPMLMVLLALFPAKSIPYVRIALMPFANALIGVLVFLFTKHLFNSLPMALLAQLVHMLSPQTVIESSHMTPRTLGLLFFFLTAIGYYFFLDKTTLETVLLVSMLTVFVLFTHKFATQILLVVSVLFSALYLNAAFIASFLAAVLLAIVISRGFYLKILRGHMAMFNFWSYDENRKNVLTHQIKDDKLTDVTAFIDVIKLLMRKSQVISFFFANPFILIPGFLILGHDKFIPSPDGLTAVYYLSNLVIISVACGILTASVNTLRTFGEGFKYIFYTIPVTAILTAYLFFRWDNNIFKIVMAGMLILLLAQILFLQYKAIVKDRSRSKNSSLNEILKYINETEESKNMRIMTMPLGLADAIMAFIKGKVFSTDSAISQIAYRGYAPKLTKPFNIWFKEYGITHFLLNKNYTALSDCKVENLCEPLCENRDYVLMKVMGQDGR